MRRFSGLYWQDLVQETDLPKSVHLSDWPEAGVINKQLLNEMAQARQSIAIGLAKRAEAGIKVRQPLSKAIVLKLPEQYKDVIAEELNVKQVNWGKEVEINTDVTPELKREGMTREIIRFVQNTRKEAGLNVDDRIKLWLITTDKELERAVNEHTHTIKAETLASELDQTGNIPEGFQNEVNIEGVKLQIIIQKNTESKS